MLTVKLNSGEGLVIKHPLSLYQLGGREHSWIKIKPGPSLPLNSAASRAPCG